MFCVRTAFYGYKKNMKKKHEVLAFDDDQLGIR